MSGNLIARFRRAARGDDGVALVAVIGIAAVLAIFAVILVSSVVFAVGQSTSSRASVSAKSSAEAGIEAAASGVTGGACWSGGAGSSSSPHWKAQVQRLVSATADPGVESSWVNGCPVVPAPPGSTFFRVIATGWTGQKGSGNATGDVRTMVAQFSVKQTPPSPEFTQAIFGKTSTSASTNLVINGSAGDVLTDTFNCSTHGRISGDVLVNSSLTEWSTLNTDCQIVGDFISKGNLNCPAQGVIGGDVIVAGNIQDWNSTCITQGNMWVGGNLNCPAGGVIHGNLTVVGDVTISTGCTVGGNVYIGGNLTISNNWTFPANVWVKGNINANGGVTLTSTGGGFRVGGSLTGGLTAAHLNGVGAPSIGDASLAKPAAPDMQTWFPTGDPMLNFPKMTTTDARWSGWTMKRWQNDIKAIKSSANPCDAGNPGNINGTLTITTPTIYDLTQSTGSGGCGTSTVGLGGSLTIKLYADAVMFVSSAKFESLFSIVSGDGAKHSLYIVVPWPSSLTACSSSYFNSNGAVNLYAWGNPTISQGSNTSLMIYTPGTISANGSATVTGQLYGCKVDLSNPVTLNFLASNAGAGSAGRSFAVTERFRMDAQSFQLAG